MRLHPPHARSAAGQSSLSATLTRSLDDSRLKSAAMHSGTWLPRHSEAIVCAGASALWHRRFRQNLRGRYHGAVVRTARAGLIDYNGLALDCLAQADHANAKTPTGCPSATRGASTVVMKAVRDQDVVRKFRYSRAKRGERVHVTNASRPLASTREAQLRPLPMRIPQGFRTRYTWPAIARAHASVG